MQLLIIHRIGRYRALIGVGVLLLYTSVIFQLVLGIAPGMLFRPVLSQDETATATATAMFGFTCNLTVS